MLKSTIPAIPILLIEDNSFVCNTIRCIVRQLGAAEIRTASDGSAALALLAAGFEPSIVLCDVQMAPMDGLSFLQNLRASNNRVRAALPVLMLTAVSDEPTMVLASQLGISGYLLKPVSPSQIALRINAVLQRRRACGALSAIST